MFEYRTNSLIAASISTNRSPSTYKNSSLPHWPKRETLDSLSTVSAFYLYTNPPPMGYGTPAPKVAESVLRAYSYNRNPPDRATREIDNWKVNVPYWLGPRNSFPFDQVHGNFHVGESHDMFKKMLVDNFENIQVVCDSVINHFLTTNSSVLTKGRQTWCPLTEQSMPSALAYKNMHELFEMNLGVKATNCLEWAKCFFDMLNLKEIKYRGFVSETHISYSVDKVTKTKIRKIKNNKKAKSITIKGEDECYRFMMDVARSFCSYIKHGERGKLQRRAIASANMILRVFLYMVEEFHLKLSKLLPGSTISIGGEEKKKRISLNLQGSVLNNPGMEFQVQATQDATKWNECLSADIFALLHLTWFKDDVRNELGLPRVTRNETLFLQICLAAHQLLAIKRITLGEGPMCYSEDGKFNRPRWTPENLNRFNVTTRAWFEEAIPLLSGDKAVYLESSPGMLMGMHNALSTTVGLAPEMHRVDPTYGSITTLRSSDDSMTLYMTSKSDDLADLVEKDRRNLKLVGINLSENKTFLFKVGFGEYTSWFQDGDFVAQFGVETSTIRPQGKNPSDDLYTIAKSTSVSQQRLEMNPFGAHAKIKIGIDNCRKLWRIEYNPEKRDGISGKVLMTADGGRCLWTPMRCHLEETSMKEHFATTNEEKKYLLKIRHPDNPFSAEPSEDVTYSNEAGRVVTDITEIPRTIFHYVKRTNRTKKTNLDTKAAIEDNHKKVLEVIEAVHLPSKIKKPSTSVSLKEFTIAHLRFLRATSVLTAEEQNQYEKALNILLGKEDMTEDWDEDS